MTPRTYDRIVDAQNELSILLDSLGLNLATRIQLIGEIRSNAKFRAALTEMCLASGQGVAEQAQDEERQYSGEFGPV